MAEANANLLKLPGSYLFAEIAKRVRAFTQAHPDADIIRLGIGDVTQPLCPAVIQAMRDAVDEMARAETFKGYGPDYGYAFLVDAIRAGDYAPLGVDLAFDEVFISDGSKCDVANFQELFSAESRVAVTDPVYPVYVDTNAMAGRAGELTPQGRWQGLVYLPCHAENGFVPALPERPVDIIYLCYPNNPTGTTLTRGQLQQWVDYARDTGAVILYDAAYRAYITRAGIPRSIYEIAGADKVAVEFCSFSKTAGFTGTRCAYTVVPHAVAVGDGSGGKVELNALWKRRQSTKFNGVAYPVQRGAAAVYTPQGRAQTQATVAYYMENARIIRDALAARGVTVFGGVDAPYIWMRTPAGLDSWAFFDYLLESLHIVGTPGAGFGPSGEGYFRLTAFNTLALTRRAAERFAKLP
ncbi:MAG: LL-diaminopimelate aminotransferase [Oscillospiraceae bacterium]|jgi:LL-diaminopimelate aminotransferase|nr:LL-diaminopimelate aminotransferase [Oscillospiraceae bacterium]